MAIPSNHPNSFGARSSLRVGARELEIFSLTGRELADLGAARLPYSLKVLLETLLRHEDGLRVSAPDIAGLASWASHAGRAGSGETAKEIAFSPERVLMQDLTGVPAVVDLAAMRTAIAALGGDPGRINPLVPVELVIDHSVIAERSGTGRSFDQNVDIEYQRNLERYQLLAWAQQAFENFRVVPPGTGICHQVNLEYLARVVFDHDGTAYPDTLVGMDSHTTMVNGLGVLGFGVGGIEAEAAMLGQPYSMVVPPVVGLRLDGKMPEGTTATDLVLTITALLRKHGVVGKFVECFGPGIASVPVENRATIGNMTPEYGATCTIFPIDETTISYLRFTGRDEDHLALVEAYARAQGLWHEPGGEEPEYTELIELDLSTVEPSLAGPARPQDRVSLKEAAQSYRTALGRSPKSAPLQDPGAAEGSEVRDGDVVIAAITSCTNTSNPQVMVGAGLLAQRAVARGLSAKPWVKTSLAPGSRVVMDYLERADLIEPLDALGFYLVGFGCTTCIGNSGPLKPGVSEAIQAGDLSAAAVLSGNRNFEGRIHPDVRLNYLASPPLVVAYALAGSMNLDLTNDPLGTASDGGPVFLRDLWPSEEEVAETVRRSLGSEMFRSRYAAVFEGDQRWKEIPIAQGKTFAWDPDSTYVKRPPFLDDMGEDPAPVRDIEGARVLALLGDSVTTDHISPAGSIGPSTPAGRYLTEHGVERADFNSYGTRRGNHEVMVRGTFANIRLRNRLAPGTEGGFTLHLPEGEQSTIYEASLGYQEDMVPLIVIAGKEYGTGSSRDWAAKGPNLLGVKAAIAEGFERIHRTNLIGMGVLPLQFAPGESAESLGLDGHELYSIGGLDELNRSIPKEVRVRAVRHDGSKVEFGATVRIDTETEARYYRNGGILRYVLRQLAH